MLVPVSGMASVESSGELMREIHQICLHLPFEAAKDIPCSITEQSTPSHMFELFIRTIVED